MSRDRTEKQKAATKRRQAEEGFTPEERDEQILAALTAERQGYQQRHDGGDADVKAAMKRRLAAVDAELARVKKEGADDLAGADPDTSKA